GRGMEGRDQRGLAVLVGLTAHLGDALGRVQQQLGGEVAEGDDDLGVDQLKLGVEPRPARFDLLRLGIAVAGRSAADGVADVEALPGEPHLLHHQLVEELAGPAHEWLAFEVLLLARGLADEHQIGVGVADTEDHLGAAFRQRAAHTSARLSLDVEEGRHRSIVPLRWWPNAGERAGHGEETCVLRVRALVCGALACLLLVPLMALIPAARASSPPSPSQDPFYTYSGKRPLKTIRPGTVLKQRAVQLAFGAGNSTPIQAEQLLYRTTGQ